MRKNITSTLMTLALAVPLAAQAPAPTAAPPATPAAAQAAPSPNTWQLDANHTTAGFSVRHMMVTNVYGTFGKVSGTINYDGKDVSTIAADVSIEATSINTNNEKRDAHLRSPDFFDTTNHPNITFKSKRAVKGSAPGTFKLVGDLTIRGVTKEVTLDVEGPTQTINAGPVTKIGATATTSINRHDFGVKWNRAIEAGGVTVGDMVKITIDIEANRRNATAPSNQ
jgi:polyisoprenoid-binding protein YceI